MLLERKHCFEKRCKGNHYFVNLQTFLGFRSLIRNFAPKKQE